jgi:hypothetical protein
MKFTVASVPRLQFLLGFVLAFAGITLNARADVDPQLGAQQVDQLLGPIALYPDALVAIILPASTFPGDLAQAQSYLSSGGNPDQIDYQPWDESVKALARYPVLIQWLNENMTWTQQLGSAFLNQPDSVMESVQRLRAQARANGTLTSTPQQKLVLDGDEIEIVPAQPDVIYVPYYDPNQVYGEPGYYGGPAYMTFGTALPLGYWLSYDFNWRTRVIIVGDRHHNWSEHRDWNHGPGGKPNYGHNWRPWTRPTNRPAAPRPDSHRPFTGVAQPRPYPGTPYYPTHDQRPERPRPNTPTPPSNDRTRPPTPAANDRNRPPVPTNNRDGNQGGPEPRPSTSPGPHPQPRPTLPPPSGPMLPPSANPRPDRGNAPVPQPGTGNLPVPGPDRQYPTRPQPQPQPRPAPPKPAAPPPQPAPKDNPRDDKPEPPR